MLRELRTVLPYLRRYRVTYTLGVAALLVFLALRVWVPKLVGGAFDELRELAGEEVLPPPDVLRPLIAHSALVLVAVATAIAIARTTSRIFVLGNSRKAVNDLRSDVFDHLLKLSPSFYLRHPTGDVMSRVVNDARNVQGLLGPVFMYLIEVSVLYAMTVPMMFSIDPLLTLVGIAPFPLFVGRARRLAVDIQEGSRKAQEGLADVSAKVDESLSGQMVIKSLTLEEHDLTRFAEHCGEYRRLNLEVADARARLVPMMSALANLSTLSMLVVGGPRVASGAISPGEFISLVLYLAMIAGPSRTLGFVMSSLQRGAAAVGRLRVVLEVPETLEDPPAAEDAVPRTGTEAANGDRASLAVRDLTVAYPNAVGKPASPGEGESSPGNGSGSTRGESVFLVGEETLDTGASLPAPSATARAVLEDVDFEVPSGTTLGIVGHTGSGKTTLLRAMSRQIEVAPGRVLLAGHDVTERPLAETRSRIAFVPQDGFLFSATLRENVCLGRPDATDAEVDAAVEAAQLSNDLEQLPKGLDTLVGERGVNLSGGQRQRAGLARAILMDAPVLMLDDCLSAVDTHTSEEILRRIRPIMRGRTTVIVAHRVATVKDADQILVLDGGRVVERGSHDELVRAGGPYAALYERQELRHHLAEDLGVEEEDA